TPINGQLLRRRLTSQLPFTWVFFFFQAEDGIRDGHVTGVQTCALPISDRSCPTPRPGARAIGLLLGLVVELQRHGIDAVPQPRKIGRASCREKCRSWGSRWH